MSITIEQQANAILGESPIWSATEQALYWIDISRPALFRYTPGRGQTGIWPMPSDIGAAAFWQPGRMLVSLEREGLCALELGSGVLTELAHPARGWVGRFNDGRVDPRGRFYAGWAPHDRSQAGRLFRMDGDCTVTVALDDVTAPNGIGWSPDGTAMYVTDSQINTIWRFDYDLAAGTLSNRAAFVRQPRESGIYDGLCVDREGCVWTALYGGGSVLRLSPSGSELSRIAFPVRLTTACCFGGADYRTLLVTSAIRKQTASELSDQPAAGSLFSLSASARGMPEMAFAGDRAPK
jgi:sugar lactone lactonase YvrE